MGQPPRLQVFYSRPITLPKTRRDELANFVQIIINKLESGDTREALHSAVDLLDDINCGNYDSAVTDAAGYSAEIQATKDQHTKDIIAATQNGHEAGIRDEKMRIAKLLELS